MTADKTAADVSREAALDAVCQHRSPAAAAAALGITAPELRTALHSFPPKTRKPRAPRAAKAAPAPTPAQPAVPSTAELQRTIERMEANAALQASMIERLMAAQKPTRAQASTVAAQVRRAPLQDDEDDTYQGVMVGIDTVRHRRVLARPSAEPVRVLVVGDSHFHPGMLDRTLRCMSLAGHHAAAMQPDHLVHIGDGSDWASVCRHVHNDTWRARTKPSIAQDLRCFRENWLALNAPMDAAGVSRSRHYCMGNHDAWLWDHEDSHPEAKALATEPFTGMLEDSGWSHTEYGEFAYLGGVGFVHVPLPVMGKPVAGELPENGVAMRATHDLVFGHTHRHNAATRTKVGFANKVTVLNAGSSMPEYYVGDYARNTAGSAISSGVCEVDIYDGRIQGFHLVSMRELERRYGHLVEQGRA